MRIALMLAACSGMLAAQSTLTTTFAGNNAHNGNMFDVVATNPAGVTVRYLDLNLTPGTWDIEVYTRPGGYLPPAPPATWTLIASQPGLASNGTGVATRLPTCLDTFVPSGARQAFYVTITNGGFMNYTTGIQSGALFAANADLQFFEGAGVVYPFATLFTPRVWNGNIYYDTGNTVGQPCTLATQEPYGTGCGVLEFASFYEFLQPSQMTLVGHRITGVATPTGYSITTSAVSNTVTPGPTAVALTLADDDEVDTAIVGGTLGIAVGSNCWIARGTGNDVAFEPSLASMLGNPAEALYAWTDLAPDAVGSGQVWYEESGSVATVTYDGVFGWGTSAANTVQFVWDTNTGDFSIEFDTASNLNPEQWLVGYSPGGPSTDPGATVLLNQTPSNPLVLSANDRSPLELTSNRPVIGSTWGFTTSGLDPVSPIAVTFFGTRVTTPVPMQSLGIAAPGCDALVQALTTSLSGNANQGSASISIPIPANPALVGLQISAQSIGLTLQNAANIQVSNGIEGTLGT